MIHIDNRLLTNTKFACDLSLCRVLIQNDTRFPWFILIPKVEAVTELFELTQEDQNQLMLEITCISLYLKEELYVHKVNIGALGNIVPQLHVHAVGRMQDDAAWPGPVWGTGIATHYTNDEIKTRIQSLNDWLTKNSMINQ